MGHHDIVLTAAVVTCLLTGNASAESRSQIDHTTRYGGYAEVVNVKPVVSRQMSQVPVKRCTWERLPARVRYYPERHERQVTERRAKRCRTVYESRVTERTTAYHVTLQYNGVTFSRRTYKHPGTRMPVRLEISPLHPHTQ